MIKPPLIWLMYLTLWIQVTLSLKKSNSCVPLLNTIIIYSKTKIYVKKLISTPFNPFDIKCKELNTKNLWKCIFRASRKVSFWYFCSVALDNGSTTQYLLEFSYFAAKFLNSFTCLNSVAKKTARQIYSKWTINSSAWRLVLLLLTLNIFCILLYNYYCRIWTNKCRLGLRNYSFRK